MKEQIFTMVLEASITVGIVIVLLKLLAPFLKKHFSATGFCFIWLLLAIRLILPIHLSAPDALWMFTLSKEASEPAPAAFSKSEPVLVSNAQLSFNAVEQSNTLPPSEKEVPIFSIVTIVWAAGVCFFLFVRFLGYSMFCRKIRYSCVAVEPEITRSAANAASSLDLFAVPALYTCSAISSPLLVGIFRPKLLLPSVNYTETELSFILKHELVHYKHHDLLGKLLLLLAQAIHWFNPLVYLMVLEANRDMEFACDDAVIKNAGSNERIAYSEVLLSAIQKAGRQTALTTHFNGGIKLMKERFQNIFNKSKKHNGAAMATGVFAASILIGSVIGVRISTQAAEPQSSSVVSYDSYSGTAYYAQESYVSKKESYSVYEKFGLSYKEDTNEMYFNGKKVRYFSDFYPIDDKISANQAGIDFFDKSGVIDVYAVRDLTNLKHNADGSYDPSGVLTSVKECTKEEFDSRDIKTLNKPVTAAEATSGTAPSLDELEKQYSVYKPYGVTYDKKTDQMYYNGQKVRYFLDIFQSNGESLSGGKFEGSISNNYFGDDGTVDIYSVRDYSRKDSDGNGTLTGVNAYSQEEFDQRTKEATLYEHNSSTNY